MNFHDWVTSKHQEINKAILNCASNPTSGSWDENTITAAVLVALGTEGTCHWDDQPQRVNWKTCKLVGDHENKRGDIALRVRVRIAEDTYVVGVAFYEAKRGFYDKNKRLSFTSLDKEQLQRLTQFTGGNSQILLYAVLASVKGAKAVSRVLPLSFATAYKEAGRVPHSKLLGQGLHFMQVLSRHLLGFHLDTRPEALDAFKDGLGHYDYVIAAEISLSHDLEPGLDESWNVGLNYRLLEAPPAPVANPMPATHTDEPDEPDEPDEAGSKARIKPPGGTI